MFRPDFIIRNASAEVQKMYIFVLQLAIVRIYFPNQFDIFLQIANYMGGL